MLIDNPLRIRLLVLVLVLVSLMSGIARAGDSEASRQLEFARVEITEGRFDRALQSAESALRLDPSCYEALVVKALAHEGLGNEDVAEALLVAYLEMVDGLEPLAEAREALERLRAPDRSSRRSRSRGPIIPQAEEGPEYIEVDVFRERVQTSLRRGECALARATAEELLHLLPSGSEGWFLLGEAERCAGRTREAVLAYQRWDELGGEDPDTERLAAELSATLGWLEVEVSGVPEEVVPWVVLRLGDEELRASPSGAGFVLRDLPPGASGRLSVAGVGIETLTLEVGPFTAGVPLAVVVEPVFVGTAEFVVAGGLPRTARLELEQPSGPVELREGERREVTAGQVLVAVYSGAGTVRLVRSVGLGERLEFDPGPWVPSELTLIGIPMGSTVVVETDQGPVPVDVPLAPGSVDPETGVLLASPLHVDSLVPGQARLHVQHPTLGETSLDFALRATGANATTLSLDLLPGVAPLAVRYRARLEQEQLLRLGARRRAAVGLGVGGGLLAGGIAALLGALDQGAKADDLRDRHIEVQSICRSAADCPESDLLTNQREANARSQRALLGLAAGGAAGAGVAFGLTAAFGGRAQRALRLLPPWGGQNDETNGELK